MGLKEDSAAGQAIAAVTEGAQTLLPLFVDFTSGLLSNVLESITAFSLEQLEAYADLVARVSGTLADFQERTLGAPLNDSSLNYVNDVIVAVFGSSPASKVTDPKATQLIGFDPAKVDELKASFAGVELPGGSSSAPVTFDQKLVLDKPQQPTKAEMQANHLFDFAKAKLQRDTEASYRTLITLLQLGMQKVVPDRVTVMTSITLHVDSTDTFERTSSQTEIAYSAKAFNWGVNASLSGGRSQRGKIGGNLVSRSLNYNIGGHAGGSRQQSNLRINVVNEKKTAVTNTSVDITGSFELHCRTETFPPIDPSTLPAPV